MERTPPFPDAMGPDAGRAGFALPATLLVLALVCLLTATGFFASWLEVRSSGAFIAGTRAFYVADAGLATALATASPGSPLTIAVGGGVATVRFRRLLDLGPGEALFLVDADGAVVARGDTTRRGVTRVAWVGDPPRAAAALLVADTLRAASATGILSGIDLGPCGGGPIAGVASWLPPALGPGLAASGTPSSATLSPASGVTRITGIRWADLVGAGGPVPDAVVPPDPWPSSGSPTFVRVGAAGPLGPGRSGAGVLLAPGDLRLDDGFGWTGLILVGGSLSLAGDVTVRGAVATGLDTTRAGVTDLGPGRVDVAYDSCAVAAATARLRPLPAAIPGSWRERW